ncbi:DNA ligase [Cesiribacter andamanensis AMV16]|uniref:DNA ligase n=1 Tax=Cesiribacter andamanensis AMV16 TaxID=1279009 RepID=M7NHR4_9BACT|nr:DNA ligase [Cesiribacter andamanensis AMV16]
MQPEEARHRIDTLKEQINYYNEQYYQHNNSEITDYEFDQLLEELVGLEEQYPDFRTPRLSYPASGRHHYQAISYGLPPLSHALAGQYL